MKKEGNDPKKPFDIQSDAIRHVNKKLQELDPCQPEVSALDMRMVGVAWVAVGFMLTNLDLKSIPWLTALGWIVMSLGAFTVLMMCLGSKPPKE